MCDCPQRLAGDKIVGKIDPETVTLFSKCFTSYRPGKDILEHKIPSNSNCTSIDSVQSNSSDTTSDYTKKSLSSLESSSESSRSVRYRQRNIFHKLNIRIVKINFVPQTNNYLDNRAVYIYSNGMRLFRRRRGFQITSGLLRQR